MSWTKAADWLPMSNAVAQVNFWQGDLAQAQHYLTYVKSFKKYNLSGYAKMLDIAAKDVIVSQRELEKAKAKLIETQKREKDHYKRQ